MHATRFSFVLVAIAAACSSSSPESPARAEPPDLVVSASCSRREDTVNIAVAITNRGRGPAAPSATRVEFNDDPASAVLRHTHFIAAHGVDTFEVELPGVCSKIACRWTITVDAAHPVRETGRC